MGVFGMFKLGGYRGWNGGSNGMGGGKSWFIRL